MNASADNEKLNRLLDDVLTEGEVTPEQLLQYAEQPETLSARERAFIETAIEESPALADELRVLKSFSLPGVAHMHSHTPHHSHKSQTGLLQQLAESISKLFDNLLIPAGAMAVIALSIVMVVVMDQTEQQPGDLADTGTTEQQRDGLADTGATEQQPDGLADTATTPVTPKNTTPALVSETTQPEQALAENAEDTKPENESIDIPIPAQPPQSEMMMLAMIEPQYHSGYGQDVQVVIRGATEALKCLAPAMANTASEQPVLYWSLPVLKPNATLQLEISIDATGEIILSKALKLPTTPGEQKIAMKDFNIKLSADTVYQWTLILQADINNPALDKFTTAKIKYVKPDGELLKQIRSSDVNSRANVYATHGYWYDALSHVIEIKQQHPDNDTIAKAYTSLLSQVGLQN